MNEKHTPGPWIINTCVRTAINSDKKHIAMVNFGGWKECRITEEEHEANARLIAAAPDLLDALKKAVRELNEIRARDGVPYTHQGWQASVTEEYFSSVVDEGFSAIAKAEGKES